MASVLDPIIDFCVGEPLTLPHSPTELPTPITSAILTVHSVRGSTGTPLFSLTISTTGTASGQITNAGVLQTDGTYTASLFFDLSASNTLTMTPGVYCWGTIQCLPGPYSSAIVPFFPLQGGPNG